MLLPVEFAVMSRHDVRHEVETLRRDMNALNALNLDEQQASAAVHSTLGGLRRDLTSVMKQLEQEQESSRILREEALAVHRDPLPQDHFEALAQRERDIQVVKEEKRTIFEWLQRGVSEAQKISADADQYRLKLGELDRTRASIEAENAAQESAQQKLQLEIEELKAAVRKNREARDATEMQIEQQQSLLLSLKTLMTSSESQKASIQEERERLLVRVRDVERIEIAVGCMAASVRRAQHHLQKLLDDAASAEFGPDEDDFDSEHEADATTISHAVLASTKAKVARCDALLASIWNAMKRIDVDNLRRTATLEAAHNDVRTQLLRELDSTRDSFKREIAKLTATYEKRGEELKRFLVVREEAVKKAAAMAFGIEDERPFSLMEYFELDNDRLRKERQELRELNERLKEKVASRQADFDALTEMRREYRDMDARKSILAHEIRKVEDDNRRLTLAMHETPAETPKASPKRPPWRANVLD